MRRAAKRDSNERAIIRQWKAMGAYVESVSGPGLADTLVHHKGRLFRVEVKNARGKLTRKQVENFTKAWRAGVPTFIIRDVEDAKDMLECPPGSGIYASLTWDPSKGALGTAKPRARPFRPGTDKARSMAELCPLAGCVTSRVPGMAHCAAHAAEVFSPRVVREPAMGSIGRKL